MHYQDCGMHKLRINHAEFTRKLKCEDIMQRKKIKKMMYELMSLIAKKKCVIGFALLCDDLGLFLDHSPPFGRFLSRIKYIFAITGTQP